MEKQNNKVLGFIPMLALVVGSVVGAGIFNSPADLGRVANPGPILLGWLITGIGIFSLVKVFQYLSDTRPDLEGGIYSYAKEVGGEFVGFNSGYGYWWATLFGNLAFFVAILKILSFYFPILESSWVAALIVASCILWIYHTLIVSGIRSAGIANTIITVLKITPLILVIFVTIFAFDPKLFSDIFSTTLTSVNYVDGKKVIETSQSSIWAQINGSFNTMVWTFIGIEGAVVLSNKAKNPKDVGKVTFWGFVITMTIYVLVSVLTRGVVEITKIIDPDVKAPLSVVLQTVMGDVGKYIIDFGFLFSVLGALLSWLMLAAEIPFISASRDNAFPKAFAQQNNRATPVFSLTVSNIITQIVLILLFSMAQSGSISNSQNAVLQNLYYAAISLAVICSMVPYSLSAVLGIEQARKEKKWGVIIFSVLAIAFFIWVAIAMWKYATAAVIIYTTGIIIYSIALKQKGRKMPMWELAAYAVMLVLSIISIYYVAIGTIVY